MYAGTLHAFYRAPVYVQPPVVVSPARGGPPRNHSAERSWLGHPVSTPSRNQKARMSPARPVATRGFASSLPAALKVGRY